MSSNKEAPSFNDETPHVQPGTERTIQQPKAPDDLDAAQAECYDREATEEEIKKLRHTVDHIPQEVWVVALVGAIERFAFYAVVAPWRKLY
jgi:hypothetical protein